VNYDAIVLTGGSARRLGGADKAGLVVGGRTLGQRVAAALDGASRLVVVGPRPAGFPARTVTTCESPPGGGPVAAVAAGMAHVIAPTVAVLAVDLPFVTAEAVTALREALGTASGAIPVDDDGRDQPLCSVWRSAALRAALDAMGTPAGASMRRLLATVAPIVRLRGLPGTWFDCDTPADIAAAQAQARA